MVSKDQAIGGIILIVCVILGILYTLGLFYFGGNPLEWSLSFWLVAIPVFLAFIAIMAIGAWIGLTMATTPPPKPIEEITKEMEKAEEKAEEKPEEKPAAETVEEEKKTERRRKS
ncbi:MAG: hypothetical protein QXX51_04875 [Candidatus Bathyarchaeia archaeon]